MTNASELHQELAGLERDKAALEQRIAARRADNERLGELLQLLEGGLFRRKGGGGTWRLVLVALALMGISALWWYFTADSPEPSTKPVIARPMQPHVLITSEPEGARVSFASNRMPRSVARKRRSTPFYFGAPPRGASYDITVEAEGYQPMTRALHVGPRGGVHWHAVLTPRVGGR